MSKPELQEVSKWERVLNTSYLYTPEPISLQEGKSRVHAAKADHPEGISQPLAIKFFTNIQKPNKIISELIGLKMNHVVNFYDVNFENPTFVVMELCRQNLKYGGFRKKFYHSGEETLKLAQQLLHGLKELKIHRVIHCDVKPQNVVCSREGLFKLCDIDFSLTEKEASQAKIRVGTFEYMAPQILKQGSCSYQSDIWSLGVLLFEVFFGHFPWQKPHLCQRFTNEQFLKYHKAIKSELETVREGIKVRQQQAKDQETAILLQFLLACLVFDPFERRDSQDLNFLASKGKARKSSLSYLIKNGDEEQFLEQSIKFSLSKQLHHLQQDFGNLPANDLLLRKASNLISLINIFFQTLKKEEVTLVMLDSSKMMTESKKISDIIKNNIKRLGPSSSMTGLTQQKNNLADHLQAISSYLLNLHLNQEKTILRTFNRSSDQLPKK